MPSRSPALRPGPGLVVVVGAEEAYVPLAVEPCRLDLTLEAVARLGRVVAGTEEPLDDEIASLVAVLVEEGLLVDAAEAGDQDLPPPPAAAPARPSRASGASNDVLVFAAPLQLLVRPEGFVLLDHRGDVAETFTADELAVLRAFSSPCTTRHAHAELRAGGGGSVESTAFERVAARAAAAGALVRPPHWWREERERAVIAHARQDALAERLDLLTATHEAHEAAHLAATGQALIPVVPVNTSAGLAPLSLGLVVANAIAHEGGRLTECYSFRRTWVTDLDRLVATARAGPAVFLFSDYVLNIEENLALSAAVKEQSPESVTIHGGPDVPTYPEDLRRFHLDNPHVDLAVHGAGEDTFAELLAALVPVLGSPRHGRPVGEAIGPVLGVSWLSGDLVVRPPSRPLRSDLDALPSPYLSGLFDDLTDLAFHSILIETNRGCPYACDFCDWGSATGTRVRFFSLDRVLAEIDWAVAHGATTVALTDANVGMYERDLDVIRHLCDRRRTTGRPTVFGYNYAKDRWDNHHVIIGMLARAGIQVEGLIPLQTMSSDALRAVSRTNIGRDEVDAMRRAFTEEHLPLYTTILYGLPGSNGDSFRGDLQVAIDREMLAKVAATEVIVNAPLNAPAYRERYAIVDPPGEPVRSCTSFTRDEWEEMDGLRTVYLFAERRGLLREIPRYVRHETGIGEVAVLDLLRRAAQGDRRRYPVLAITLQQATTGLQPPASWAQFVDEVIALVVAEWGIPSDTALETVRQVQLAVLPGLRRPLPDVVELAHDYVRWYEQVQAAKYAEPDSWTETVPSLRTLPPATFRVEDPVAMADRVVGRALYDLFDEAPWEMGSPIQRAVSSTRFQELAF